MAVEIKVAGESDSVAWDGLVKESAYGTLFHSFRWLKLVEKYTKSKLYPLMGVDEEKIIGLFPAYFNKKFFLKNVFSPHPWMDVPYLGPVLTGYDREPQFRVEPHYGEFFQACEAFLNERLKPNYVRVNTSPGLTDVRPFTWNGFDAIPLYNYALDLTVGEEKLWSQIKKKVRQDIKRTGKRGVTVELGGLEEVRLIYDDIKDRYAEQGKVNPTPKDYLLEVCKTFQENLRVFVARHEGGYAGGHIDIYFGDRVSSWMGGVKSSIDGVSPNDLLNWEAMRHAQDNGMRVYEIVGANTPHLSPYKIKFNPRPSLYFQLKKCSPYFIKGVDLAYGLTKRTLEGLRLKRG